MEYYSEFGGVADDILEQIAQNNDLGLQISAGWIRIPILAAMETYADQEDDGLTFLLQIDALGNLKLTNQNEDSFYSWQISMSYFVIKPPALTVYFGNGIELEGNKTTLIAPGAPWPPDNKYDVLLTGKDQEGNSYEYTATALEVIMGGDAVSVVATADLP